MIDWWVRTQDLLICIDQYTRGITSAIAADRRRRIKPVTAALHQLMSAVGPALTANFDYLWTPDSQSVDEMVCLFGVYTISVREFAKTVLPDLDLDLPDQRESARAHLQATTDDLNERLAALKNPSLKEEMQRHVWRAGNVLRESDITSINELTTMQGVLAIWTGYLREYEPSKIAKAS